MGTLELVMVAVPSVKISFHPSMFGVWFRSVMNTSTDQEIATGLQSVFGNSYPNCNNQQWIRLVSALRQKFGGNNAPA